LAETPSLRLSTRPRPPLITMDNGPGRRWVLFVQGCRHPCTTVCLNPELLASAGGHDATLGSLQLLAEQVAGGTWGRVEGVTILGGEPTDQAVTLYPFLAYVRQCGLSVMLYSGHPMAWFEAPARTAERRLLEVSDILVDGPFLPVHADASLRWRGSSNQQIRRLSDRYSDADLVAGMAMRGVTVTRAPDGLVMVNGLQQPEAVRSTVEALTRSLP
jgi:anaerobic ribonucleoside-triphosphate reductase activating protein